MGVSLLSSLALLQRSTNIEGNERRIVLDEKRQYARRTRQRERDNEKETNKERNYKKETKRDRERKEIFFIPMITAIR